MRQWKLEFKLEAGGFCFEAEVPADAHALVEEHPYLNRAFGQPGVLQLFSQEEMDSISEETMLSCNTSMAGTSSIFFSMEFQEYHKLYIPLDLMEDEDMGENSMPVFYLQEEESGVFLKPGLSCKAVARLLVPGRATHGITDFDKFCPVLSISGGNEDEC